MKPIEELLTDLGDTPLKVATRLRKAGCKMKTTDAGVSRCSTCPVALYLRRNGFKEAYVALWSAYPDGTQRISLPEPVRQFVYRFDRGYYPSLAAWG